MSTSELNKAYKLIREAEASAVVEAEKAVTTFNTALEEISAGLPVGTAVHTMLNKHRSMFLASMARELEQLRAQYIPVTAPTPTTV